MAALKPFFNIQSQGLSPEISFSVCFLIVSYARLLYLFSLRLSPSSSLSPDISSYICTIRTVIPPPLLQGFFCCSFIINLARDVAGLFYLNWFSLLCEPSNTAPQRAPPGPKLVVVDFPLSLSLLSLSNHCKYYIKVFFSLKEGEYFKYLFCLYLYIIIVIVLRSLYLLWGMR